MKYILKLILVVLVGIVFLTRFDKTYAIESTEQIYFGTWIPDIYIRKDNGESVLNQQARFTRRKSDNQPVYCIEHGVLIDENEIYNSYTDNFENITGYDSDKLKMIKLIAYYGYGYENHTEEKWYAITQVLIWKTLYPNMDISYTDTFKGNKITKFVEEEQELLNLVQKHLIVPEFDYDNNLKLGESLKLVDKNNVLNEFEIEYNETVDIEKYDNILFIKPKVVGNLEIKLYKKTNRYGTIPIVYINPNSQNLMSTGDYDTLESYINVNVEEDIVEEIENPSEEETITIEVPNTLSNSNIYIYSIIFLVLGIGLIYVQKKHK